MAIWLDNHLSPHLAEWISRKFRESCRQIRDIGLSRASDAATFQAARAEARILMTKDRDFAELVARLGPPPAIILLTCGNTTTAYVKAMLRDEFAQALGLIGEGEALVEIGGA